MFDTMGIALSGRPSDGFDLHFHSFGNENKGVAAVETGGQQHATGMLHLSGFESSQKEKTTSPERNLSFFGPSDWIRTSGLLNPIQAIMPQYTPGR